MAFAHRSTIAALAVLCWCCCLLSFPGAFAQCDGPTLFSFGNNEFGQLGDGTNTGNSVPLMVSRSGVLSGQTIVSTAVGHYHSLVLSSTGNVFGFGYNEDGELGDGTNVDTNVPVALHTSDVLDEKPIIAISAGGYHSLVLSESGEVFSFGWNGYGQLGDGTTTNRNIPVAVDTSDVLNGTAITAIAGGGGHSLVLSETGEVFSFGWNIYGQLGDGTYINRSTPVPVSTSGVLDGTEITAISAGIYHSLVLSSTGHVFSFGNNSNGQLGDNTNISRTTPVAVATFGALNGEIVTAISAGGFHSLVLTNSGHVYSFGHNSDGRLGDSTFVNRRAPVAVYTGGALNGKSVAFISAGIWHSLVVTTTGKAFSFGDNWYGQLGAGYLDYMYDEPVSVHTTILGGQFVRAISGSHNSLMATIRVLGNVKLNTANPTVGQENVEISWCGNASVVIKLVRDSNLYEEDIASGSFDDLYFMWNNVEATPGFGYRICVGLKDNSDVQPSCSSTFSIRSPGDFDSPDFDSSDPFSPNFTISFIIVGMTFAIVVSVFVILFAICLVILCVLRIHQTPITTTIAAKPPKTPPVDTAVPPPAIVQEVHPGQMELELVKLENQRGESIAAVSQMVMMSFQDITPDIQQMVSTLVQQELWKVENLALLVGDPNNQVHMANRNALAAMISQDIQSVTMYSDWNSYIITNSVWGSINRWQHSFGMGFM